MRAGTSRGLCRAGATLALIWLTLGASVAQAAPPEVETVKTEFSFAELQERLTNAVEANGMIVVTKACASCGAAQRGVTIPGNMVIGVYRNDFAVRMLEASVPAGIEAPIRFYLTENEDGSASLTYPMPSSVFAPYENAELDAMAAELDQIWQKIVADTLD